ncbi:MAG: hypothetical protein AABZ53_11765 [Planctomycetota bacterium]
MPATTTAIRQRAGQQRATPASAGLPDPRPLTDYTVALSSVGVPPHARITITLSQPCIIRTPAWGFIDCTAGAKVFASSVTVVNNTTFYFDFPGPLAAAVGFVDVPYQDMQVQNFQGGFVVPGGKWFRPPVIL